ncbi:MAG: hypothetical protein U9N34_08250, partial [Candidatus Cloacimonadota bacterium]|nr:hypothetical protein [Candidatus Cloacimonadota bacterium]
KKFNTLELQTHNSLHQIIMPYVTYFVHAQTDTLIRLEAAKKILLPISYEDRFSIHADVLIQEVTDFNIYTKLSDQNQSRDKNQSNSQNIETINTILLYLKTKTLKEPLLFELSI